MSLELSGTTGVKGVAGSVSAPSIVGDDTNTGISFPSADTIKFSTGGVERMSITNSGVSGITPGITEADQWRVTSDFTMGQFAANITTNWERNDTSFEKIGTGMSVNGSNGHWTFPSTGKWLIQVHWMGRSSSGNTYSGLHYIFGMSDGNQSNGFDLATSEVGNGSNENVNTAFMQVIFDFQDTSTHRVLFGYYYYYTQNTVYKGHTSKNENSYTFIILGET